MRTLLACVCSAALPAADLLGELAIAAPRDERHAGPGGGDLGWMALAAVAPLHRIDGVARVDRQDVAPDIQVVGSLCWNRVHGSEFGGSYDWLRLAAVAGSDPLATRPGRALAGLHALWSAPMLLSGTLDAAWSADRGRIVSAEACLWFVRIRGERDGRQENVRIGTGPRFLGSDSPWSGAVLVDQVTGRNHAGRSTNGAQGEAWIAYRLTPVILLSGGIEAAYRLIDADGATASALTGTMVIGCTW